MIEYTYTVTGMTCEHCEASVQEEVLEIPGVVSAKADRSNNELKIEVESDIDQAAVVAAVAEAGYQAVQK